MQEGSGGRLRDGAVAPASVDSGPPHSGGPWTAEIPDPEPGSVGFCCKLGSRQN